MELRAGQAVYVDAIAPTMRDSCSPYRLIDPVGKDIAGGCTISVAGGIDRTDLSTDGQYSVIIDPTSTVTGTATVRVYLDQDINDTLEPNGPAKSASIDQPGAVARYRFAGAEGHGSSSMSSTARCPTSVRR